MMGSVVRGEEVKSNDDHHDDGVQEVFFTPACNAEGTTDPSLTACSAVTQSKVSQDMRRGPRSEINHNLKGAVTLCGEGRGWSHMESFSG